MLAWLGAIETKEDVEVYPIQMHTSPIKLNVELGSEDNIEMLTLFEGKSSSGV